MKPDKSPVRAARGKKSHARGLWAELLCRLALRVKGYSIVASRYRTPQGEIDIIAQRGPTLVFVEVKARPDVPRAAEAISEHQKSRLSHAGASFLAHHPRFSHHAIRFDVMLVLPWRWPIWHLNAFESRL